MTIAVLVKVVPDLDKLTFDPQTRTVRRAGAKLYMNPFDQRAVLAAVDFRAPEERVAVVSMGPPDARPALTEALALGADRVLLVSDRTLAGSDTWVTSQVLAAALRRISPDLVLAGHYSTDSETGQVPAQVAEQLGLPLVDAARRIERGGPGQLSVLGETASGSARYHVARPCLVTVGEKITKSRKPTPEALAQAQEKPFEVLSAKDLGLEPNSLGLQGSPTQILGLENEEPARRPFVVTNGNVEERVQRAVARIVELLGRPRDAAPPLREAVRPENQDGEVMVLASGPEGGVDPDALPLIAEVRRLPQPLWPSAIVTGPLSSDDRRRLASVGALRVYAKAGGPCELSAEQATALCAQVLRARPRCAAALFLSTSWSREIAGRLSGRLQLGLTGDAVGVRWDAAHGLVFHKPSFGGGLVALVVSRRQPSLATVRPGALARGALASPSELEVVPVEGDLPLSRVDRSDVRIEREERFGELDHARTVVAIGMGIGGADKVPKVLETVLPLGAALGATRRVVDAGWVPTQLQIGLTGRSLAPDLYLGVGVSGQVNHLIGVKRARVSVGINPKTTEPLFQRVDVGIVGTWQEVLGPLVEELRRSAPPGLLGRSGSFAPS
ncbi:MAG: FAD-binding protein [Euryarchaeota archaeon]|nr:FAD-binding protein [Euryarchaeota archaeon]MDE1837655.1 FAD-binding protein [Euryarchaeota archaeon]MDE1880329.1 FAD-binding protein [Euryarchaeota archaeon]MDE2046272.1 FAD-binding protein [Thermoplasmata archaeon]